MTDSHLPERFFNPSAFALETDIAIALIADLRIRQAIERGEFDDLPGSGKPLDIPLHHDPDWWIKGLMKRERLALLPPSVELRKEDAALDARLDQVLSASLVRREVEQFNERVISARYQLPEGPPLITMPRDVEATVAAWAERRSARAEAARAKASEEASRKAESERSRPRWFRRRPRRPR